MEEMGEEKQRGRNSSTVDSKYIQQHLANERTYLAWLRTSLAIMGVGTLAATLEVRNLLGFPFTFIRLALGLTAIILAGFISVLSTYNFLVNRKSINTQSFRAAGKMVWWITAGVLLIAIVLGVYIFDFLLK